MRLPFQQFSRQDVPQYAVPQQTPSVRPPAPVLQTAATNPGIVATKALTGLIDSILDATSSYQRMMLNDKRENEREEERLRIQRERDVAKQVAEFGRNNAQAIRENEQKVRLGEITPQQGYAVLDGLITSAVPEGTDPEVSKMFRNRITSAMDQQKDLISSLETGFILSEREGAAADLYTDRVLGFKKYLVDQEETRNQNPNATPSLKLLNEFRESQVKIEREQYKNELIKAGFTSKQAEEKAVKFENDLQGITYSKEVEERAQIAAVESGMQVENIANQGYKELMQFADQQSSNPDKTPNFAITQYDKKFEEIKRANLEKYGIVMGVQVNTMLESRYQQDRKALRTTLLKNHVETLQASLADGLGSFLSPQNGTTYDTSDEVKAAKEGALAKLELMRGSLLYQTDEELVTAISETNAQIDFNNAERMILTDPQKVIDELKKYNEGLFPDVPQDKRVQLIKRAESGIKSVDAQTKTVARQRIKTHLDKVMVGAETFDPIYVQTQGQVGAFTLEDINGYLEVGTYNAYVNDLVTEQAGSIEEMSTAKLNGLLAEAQPDFYAKTREDEVDNIYVDRLREQYTVLQANVKSILDRRAKNQALDGHASAARNGIGENIFSQERVGYMGERQRRISPGSGFEFIPEQVATEFKALFNGEAQEGQVFDGVQLRGTGANMFGQLAHHVSQANIEGVYDVLEEMSKKTGIPLTVLQMASSLYDPDYPTGDGSKLDTLYKSYFNGKNREGFAAQLPAKFDQEGFMNELKADDSFKKIMQMQAMDYRSEMSQVFRDYTMQLMVSNPNLGVETAAKQTADDFVSMYGIESDAVVSASNNDLVPYKAMIWPDMLVDGADEQDVADVMVDNVMLFVDNSLAKIRSNDKLSQEERGDIENQMNVLKSALSLGDTAYAWHNAGNDHFQLLVLGTNGVVASEIYASKQEIKDLIASRPSLYDRAQSILGVFGGGYGKEPTRPGKAQEAVDLSALKNIPNENLLADVSFTGSYGKEPTTPGKAQGPVDLSRVTGGPVNENVFAGIPFTGSYGRNVLDNKTQTVNSVSLAQLNDAIERERAKAGSAPVATPRRANPFSKRTGDRKLAYGSFLEPLVNSSNYNLSYDLVMAIIETESSFRPDLVGDGGTAFGLMQVRKGAYDDIAEYLKPEYTWEDVKDPQNYQAQIRAGLDYLKVLREKYGIANTAELVMAYNGGPEILKKKGQEAFDNATRYYRKVKSNQEDF